MSAYIIVALWIVVPLLVVNLVSFIFSSGDSFGGAILGLYSLHVVGWGLFLSYSFLLGYKAGRGVAIAVPVLSLIVGVYLWQVALGWGEPGEFGRQSLSVLGMFAALLVLGIVCRLGLKGDGFIRVGAIVLLVTYHGRQPVGK